MGRYSKANVLQSAIDKQNEQEQLRQKHEIKDDNIVVVEKTQFFKWLFLLMRILFTICLFAMAAIGAFTLLYADLRLQFLMIIRETINSIGG